MQGLQKLSALVQLPALAAPVDIRVAFSCFLRTIGASKEAQRSVLPDLVPSSAAVTLLQLLSAHLPEDVALSEVAAALAPAGLSGFGAEQLVQLDALLGVACLLSSGTVQDKLQLCFWALDKDSSGSLSLQQVLAVLPAVQLASSAACLLLHHATPQSLTDDATDAGCQAAQEQCQHVLHGVLCRAYQEADPHGTGVLLPGDQVMQMLFATAAQLTSIVIAAIPSPTDEAGDRASVPSSGRSTPPNSRTASASPFTSRQHTQARQQQHALPAELRPEPHHPGSIGAAAAAGAAAQMPSTDTMSGASAAERSSSQMADVVILDEQRGVLHYQTPTHEAAAAAAAACRPAVGLNSAVRAYATTPRSSQLGAGGSADSAAAATASAAGMQQQQGLSTASCLAKQLDLQPKQEQQHGAPVDNVPSLRPWASVAGQQQPQQQQQLLQPGASLEEEPSLFLSPGGTGSAEDAAIGPHSSHHHHQHNPQVGHTVGHLSIPGASGRTRSTLSSTTSSRRKMFVGSPFSTVTESAAGSAATGAGTPAGGAVMAGTVIQDGTAGEAGGPPVPGTAAGALTSTAATLMSTIQSNLAAAAAKVLLHCGLCFLLTTMVLLGDAALVVGLHMAAQLPLAVAFAVAVAANMGLVLLLVSMLLLVRWFNAWRNKSKVEEAANAPEAQQLDQILNAFNAAVEALKATEQQQQQADGVTAANSTPGLHYLSSGASSARDPELGRADFSRNDRVAGAAAGPLAVAGKLRAVWNAVGKVAGFLPPAQGSAESQAVEAEGSLGGPYASLVQLPAAGQHSSTSWGASSGPEGMGLGRVQGAPAGRQVGTMPAR